MYIAGAGKTFICSNIIDYLLDEPGDHAVAYIYFGYQDRTKQRPIDVYSIFVKQLLQELAPLPSDVEKMYDTKGTDSLDVGALRDLLFSMPQRFSTVSRRAFIVCDALDEMDQDQQRNVLLPLFREMEQAGFAIFLTSRPHPEDVRVAFADAIQLYITPHQEDLDAYVRQILCKSVRFNKAMGSAKGYNINKVTSAIISSADGMWV